MKLLISVVIQIADSPQNTYIRYNLGNKEATRSRTLSNGNQRTHSTTETSAKTGYGNTTLDDTTLATQHNST
jgi:hypothetical protein